MMNRRTMLSTLAAGAAASLVSHRTVLGADPIAFTMGTMPTDGSAQPFYGIDHNFFKEAGFDVSLTVLNNTASLASAVGAGALEVGFGSVIPLAQAHER